MAGPQPPRQPRLKVVGVSLQYLAELLEAERDRNLEFRSDVSDRLGKIETQLAVQQERMNAEKEDSSKYKKAFWSVVSMVFTGIVTYIVTKYGP